MREALGDAVNSLLRTGIGIDVKGGHYSLDW